MLFSSAAVSLHALIMYALVPSDRKSVASSLLYLRRPFIMSHN